MNIPFAVFFADDAFSTAKKIMGRQSAGKSFLRAIVESEVNGKLFALVSNKSSINNLISQITADGFRGSLEVSKLPDVSAAKNTGALYYPAPPSKELAFLRNLDNPNNFSIIGITHTLSSTTALDLIADLIFPPFKPWDALICTSTAAKQLVSTLQLEMQDYWRTTSGATKFNQVQLPIIPLGIDVKSFINRVNNKEIAKNHLFIQGDEIVFLFAGRLSYHAKANPIPIYQALQKLSLTHKVVCIEAGVFPNDKIKEGFNTAQNSVAPSVRFIHVNGNDETSYLQSWIAADIFVSLSDNIQETFGITPLEAMASGLPVIVSDWDGYKDTVRHGVDGFRISTILPPKNSGHDLSLQYTLGQDSYDMYIGRTSLSTFINHDELYEAFSQLASNKSMRIQMGISGQQRVLNTYDWPIILNSYLELTLELTEVRKISDNSSSFSPSRIDPFSRFSHFPTSTLNLESIISPRHNNLPNFYAISNLSIANFALDSDLLPAEALVQTIKLINTHQSKSILFILSISKFNAAITLRSIMWLLKFDLVFLKI
jgi:starch synthase